ncbi:hypothetical protein [Desulfobotulus sp.]|jgi:hypothetical protein|uniref:hypothetical protein n=1 Tax=Desulfobotulus sp. TaxID=1940337 RepID=UPI002A35E9A4|nr:hypothetical protein [Desulfobotulus sp.]MDY0163576.1 hypothetical protein [Desulfobotulus sp.]
MKKTWHSLLFDAADHHLLEIVQDIRNRKKERKHLRQRIGPYLHPRGIKEMAASRELRMAYATVHLLDSLDAGRVEDRLTALQALMDEVMSSTESNLRKNTARVMLQLMKELIRNEGDTLRQLALAHDFRRAAAGKPRVIRKLLQHYHLLEMPEEWNQISFDEHVHDANTKGRKSPSHLIMDAWIKGIRELRVIYYNHIPPQAISELMSAAAIMDIKASIGIEYTAPFRNRMVHFIWTPAGLDTAESMIRFFSLPRVEAFMEKARAVSRHMAADVLRRLSDFNTRQKTDIEKNLAISIPHAREEDFLAMVGSGQPALLHLSAYLHTLITESIRKALAESGDPTAEILEKRLKTLEECTPQTLENQLLALNEKPGPKVEEENLPELLTRPAEALMAELAALHPSFTLTLNLKHLQVADVAELLFRAEGRISHLEIYNLKDQALGRAGAYKEINALQLALNQGNIIILKRMLLNCCKALEQSGDGASLDQAQSLEDIIFQMGRLVEPYRKRPLKTRIGTDSTGNFPWSYGMGLVLRDTLPFRARRYLDQKLGKHHHRPGIRIPVQPRTTWIPKKPPLRKLAPLLYRLRYARLLRPLTHRAVSEFVIQKDAVRLEPRGNVITLGGVLDPSRRQARNAGVFKEQPFRFHALSYLNTELSQGAKVLIGFIPAFLTFALTKDWWLLAYFGAVIWFVITGLRNILQSVLGGGGIRRSPLLKWHDHVRWGRVADSLLFTGFSVPLLDYVVKTRILDEVFGITTTTNPMALYAFMALANGIYLSTHSFFRGLPRAAVIGNFFRSLLSIPVAIFFSAICGQILSSAGYTQVDAILQKWAAVISKAASDTVAGIIEGLADRFHNLGLRAQDYRKKMRQIFDTCMNLELAFPHSQILTLLADSDNRILQNSHPQSGLSTMVAINALDLLYFFMYQPRAQVALKQRIDRMTSDERRIFYACHLVLEEEKHVSTLLINGLLGKNFGPGLSFYLAHYKGYLETLRRWIPEASVPQNKTDGPGDFP